MAAKDMKVSKPKRHRKRQPRTQVTSDTDSASDSEQKPTKSFPKSSASAQAVSPRPAPERQTESERDLDTRFTNHYLQRATTEFAEDLDALRGAEDFGKEALDMLVFALKQGVVMFGEEERRRIVG